MKQNRRHFKNLIVNRDFQIKIIAYNLLYLLVASMLTAFIILMPDIIKMNTVTDSMVKYDAAVNFLKLSGRILPAVFVLLLISFIHMLILTHKICGPIINFNKAIGQFKKGDIKARVKLRKNDFLKEESREVNDVVEALSGFIDAVRKEADILEEKVISKKEIDSEDLKPLKEKLNQIKT